MPSRVNADHSGIGAGEDIEHSSLATGDRNRIEDGRSQNVSVQFAPTDSLRQPGVVYTIQEILAQVNLKLDEHGKQLSAIWSKVVQIEFEQAALRREMDEMKKRDSEDHDREDKERRAQVVTLYRLLTVTGLFVIIVMLAWLVVNSG